MKLRRGFIKEAEEISLSFRQEMGVLSSEPICVFRLCEHLEIPLTKLSQIQKISADVRKHLIDNSFGETKFFAVTLKPNGVPEILHNDYVSAARQHSDISHEIAHIVLGHEPHALVGKRGCRHYDKIMEREAHELGYTILIPKESALFAVENFSDRREAARYFGVSTSLLNYRIRKSNADGWAKSRSNKRRSKVLEDI
jgi:Zn-dependent peptidase ImmA (M78 family)